jgi:hypothetical protein
LTLLATGLELAKAKPGNVDTSLLAQPGTLGFLVVNPNPHNNKNHNTTNTKHLRKVNDAARAEEDAARAAEAASQDSAGVS